jgi:DNA-binding winged helix-turn-helix (wHTH) protein
MAFVFGGAMSLWFGDFELDPDRRLLLRAGEPVPLEPKAYELLALLLARRPRALSRTQIRDVVWPDTHVSESTLAVVVNAIRRALDDDARAPRFIQTVHGFGYSFCGEVYGGPEPAADTIPDQDPREARESPVSGPIRQSRPWPWFGGSHRATLLRGTIGAVAVASALAVWLLARSPHETPAGLIRITPLTTDGGVKEQPQLSPDGERVAYSWDGPADDNRDIYVKAVGLGTKPLRLTDDPGMSTPRPGPPMDGRSRSCAGGRRGSPSSRFPRSGARSESSSR